MMIAVSVCLVALCILPSTSAECVRSAANPYNVLVISANTEYEVVDRLSMGKLIAQAIGENGYRDKENLQAKVKSAYHGCMPDIVAFAGQELDIYSEPASDMQFLLGQSDYSEPIESWFYTMTKLNKEGTKCILESSFRKSHQSTTMWKGMVENYVN